MAPTADPTAATDGGTRPYFLWWTDVTVGEFVRHLEDPDPDRRAYWLGALLREAHTRDVWRYTTPAAIRALWPHVVRHLGRSRPMWTWLLQIDSSSTRGRSWPPSTVAHRDAVRLLPDVAADAAVSVRVVRDAGTFVRAVLSGSTSTVEIDLVHEPVPDVGLPGEPIEGVQLEPFEDLRANKLTCILSRSEPRDLVDLLFLDRAGFAPEADLPLALKKDGSVDPGALAWLLSEFPVEPLPIMLEPLSAADLRAFRDGLAERLRRLVVPGD